MAKPITTYSLRGASQYLATKGVDVSELRMRTLVRQHEIFVQDENTAKQATGDTEVQTWRVSQPALDAYAKAAASGGVRTSTGAKAYKVSLTTEQLAELRDWCAARSIAEPERANKTYTGKKGKSAPAGAGVPEGEAVGSDTIAGAFGQEGDDEGLFDEVDESEEVEA